MDIKKTDARINAMHAKMARIVLEYGSDPIDTRSTAYESSAREEKITSAIAALDGLAHAHRTILTYHSVKIFTFFLLA